MAHHLRTVPEAPSSRTEVAVPAALDRILLDCLAKDPGLRPATADELATRLRAASVEAGRWTEEEAHRWWARHATRTGHEDPVQGGRS
jgi:serine/threonine-protein kinase